MSVLGDNGIRKRKSIAGGETLGVVCKKSRGRGQGGTLTCGATFGCTLGNITGYLEGRMIRAERASILRTIHRQLAPAAAAVATINGDDRLHLARGLASCRVVPQQRACLPELQDKACPTIDSKYGNVGTAVGATATLLVAFGVMGDIPNDRDWFLEDSSVVKAMRCNEATLGAWRQDVARLPEDHRAALEAELRCLQRARLGATAAMDAADAQGLCNASAFRLQLQWARCAAYPSGKRVSNETQAQLCRQITDGSLLRDQTNPRLLVRQRTGTAIGGNETPSIIPLSEIREKRNHFGLDVTDDASVSETTSSWNTISSRSVSAFSCESADSLGSLIEPFEWCNHVNA
jgi:hypothetical protein